MDTGSDKVKYEFDDGNLNYEDQITYDEDCLLSPRITKAYNNSDWGMDWKLSYDELGRYSGRKENFNFMFGTCPDMSISYKRGTLLKEQIEYQKTHDSTTHKERIKQEYDARGNILSIEDTNTFPYFKGTNKSVYEYDDVNRLIKEEVSGMCAFTREYTYGEEGNISTVKQGNEVESYTYSQGRLTNVKVNGIIKAQYEYDLFGNPVNYNGKTMTWERGTYLKSYNGADYTYDGHGNLYKKQTSARTTINYYDGNKLIAQKVGNKIIRYFYDIEGVVGFKIGTADKYTYAKDAQGNVVGLFHDNSIGAKYVYDAWGNCTALDENGNEITEWDNPAVLNPIRWKSQYYDADSGLYLIGQRWYDPEIGRYVSLDSPEVLLQNAGAVYGLNLYTLCTENPVAVMFSANTFMPSLDFYYNGEYKTWWEKNGLTVMLVVGVVATITACVVAPFTCGASMGTAVAIGVTLAKIALTTAVGAAISLAIGGAVAGVVSALTGHGFWQAFGENVSENFVDAVVTSFAFSAVSVAASNLIQLRQCFKEGTLVETEDGLKPIEEIEVGDKVLAYDEETGEQAYKPVVQLFRNKSNDWTGVTVNGLEIISTPGHKYYLPETKKWVSAEDLRIGTKVLLSNGSYGIIEAVKVLHYDEPQTTYNFEVADFHTYYVGTGVLVHNMNCADCGSKNEIRTGKTKNYSVHETRRAAYRAAKRDAGVVSNQPTKVGAAKNRYGHRIEGKTYSFGEKQILWHSAGHPEYGMTRHFNFGDKHYFY